MNKNSTFLQMSNELNVSERAFSRVLKEADVNTHLKNRYTIEHEDYFQQIDTEFKAYILGFIYADGFVGDNNDFAIALSDQCEDNFKLLNRLKDELGITVDVKHTKQKCNNKIYGQVSLRFVSKQIINDLNSLGVHPRKSLTLEHLPIIPHNLYNHFIRGYFDGDGSICSYYDSYDKRQRNCLEILGTELFLLEMQTIFVRECNVKQTKLHKTHSYGITRIQYKGNSSIIKIREYLYKNATVYINYKHDRMYNIE